MSPSPLEFELIAPFGAKTGGISLGRGKFRSACSNGMGSMSPSSPIDCAGAGHARSGNDDIPVAITLGWQQECRRSACLSSSRRNEWEEGWATEGEMLKF